jgi:hypothetical protein
MPTMKEYKFQAELDLFRRAELAAAEATQKMLNENPGVWFPCGFAWVTIRPARGRFVSMLKDQDVGRTDSYEGGYAIWNPSRNSTQWMDAKIAGCRAFAEVLREAGIKCSVNSRID